MFDKSVPEPSRLAELTAAELIDAAGVTGRAENAACARKLAVMAELFARRTGLAPEDRLDWWVDPDAAVAAEIAAAFGITQGLALHQTYRGVVLRVRLPKIGALFLDGLISDLLVRAIITRTDWIIDNTLIAAVDTDLAAEILGWGPLSIKKTAAAIDAIVARHDPDAVHPSRDADLDRTVEFGQPGDAPGFSTIYARLFAADTAAAERTITAMAYSVCDADPRTLADRRNDAFTALMHGNLTLACHCNTPDCEAATNPTPLRDITLYAITDNTTPAAKTEAEVDVDLSAGNNAAGAEADVVVTDAEAPRPVPEPPTDENATAAQAEVADAAEPNETGAKPGDEPADDIAEANKPAQARPGYIFGSGFMPAPLFAAMTEGAATTREITHPGNAAPEAGRFPSAALAAFIRCRDLTCRFPGCDKPATGADIDHTVAHPAGPTHASNLKALCRFHHLLKTFWTGPGGWRDRQLPDGTIIWTAPTGHTYTTHPGSKLLYPTLCLPTATLWHGDPPPPPSTPNKGDDSMPRRRRTRAQGRAGYIAAQRLRNRTERLTQTALNNGDTLPPDYDYQTDPAGYGNDPPPF
ncbi:HNH endonuclease signature motif containing protein [Mycobacterium sp. 236(2023)]|uniref:HNH endonuclease signature motif containing protein n=1 Tax=Mycobacterium sp. 236(2023) TaxID=3038163 RepID=UPI0024152BBF|nr:HNH endonuclease signature motif containing protein [Mycobacterium sp. 236(2023)]MDG4664061.1 DUF222 domain-containing protein [Mycobacterium sp. 236(2023)]